MWAPYEALKPAKELVEKANQEVVANSVEEAKNYLQELTKTYAEDVADKALPVKQAAEDAIGAALDSYIKQNPQPLKPGDDEFYRSLCDAIGIEKLDLNAIKMAVWNEVFPPFKKQVAVEQRETHFEALAEFLGHDNGAEVTSRDIVRFETHLSGPRSARDEPLLMCRVSDAGPSRAIHPC
jgi:hypothetical protein